MKITVNGNTLGTMITLGCMAGLGYWAYKESKKADEARKEFRDYKQSRMCGRRIREKSIYIYTEDCAQLDTETIKKGAYVLKHYYDAVMNARDKNGFDNALDAFEAFYSSLEGFSNKSKTAIIELYYDDLMEEKASKAEARRNYEESRRDKERFENYIRIAKAVSPTIENVTNLGGITDATE